MRRQSSARSASAPSIPLGDRLLAALLSPLFFNLGLVLIAALMSKRGRLLGSLLYMYGASRLSSLLFIALPAAVGFLFGPAGTAKLMGQYIDRLLREWQAQKLRLLPSYQLQLLQQQFSGAGVPLPGEVAAMYSLCGGMAEDETDSSLFALWPVERLLREAKRYPPDLVPFADGSFSAYSYLYRPTRTGNVQVLADEHFSGEKAVVVAESLAEAFHLLLTEPQRLWLSR